MDTAQTPPAPPVAPAASEDKTVAIIAYLTLIGFIVAIVMHGNKKTKLGSYHLRQMLGLILTSIGLWVINFVLVFIPILGWITGLILFFGLVALWIMGLIAAANGQFKPVPVLGPMYQKWFGTAFE